MPRDINGVYSLPSGNPVAPGTTIEDSWANSTLADIAQAITDSLSRTGQGGMQYPLTFGDGTLANPGISWTNEPASGFYRAGAADTRLTLQGYGDTMRWYNGTAYVRNAADTAWAAIVYQGGLGTVPAGVANLDTLVWNSSTSAWARQAKNPGGVLPVGSSTLTALQWNNTSLQWEAVAASAGAVLGAGTATGQIPVWNNSTARWDANSLLMVSNADSAVAIGTGMSTATGCTLSVLGHQWVGNAAGTLGLNLSIFTSPSDVVALTAGSRVNTLLDPAAKPLIVAGSTLDLRAATDVVVNAHAGTIKLQADLTDALVVDEDANVTVGGASANTSRLLVVALPGDGSIFRVFTAGADEVFNVTNSGHVKLLNLPTSSVGLPSGALYRSGTDIRIV